MEPIIAALIAVVATCVIVIPLTIFFYSKHLKKSTATAIGNAQDKAREIIDEALKTAEAKKRESLVEIKEESIRAKN